MYLDNAATTQKPRQVIDSIVNYYENFNSNVHRGSYSLSVESSEAWEKARATVASFINAKQAEELIFTRNASESLNLVANCLFRSRLKAGDEVIVTRMEHHSNLVPWQQLAIPAGVKVHYVKILPGGLLDLDDFESLLSKKVKVAAFTHCSNILGTINPVKELCKKAHEVGALCVVDGAQSAPHMKVDVQDIDCDFYAFSGHKMLGPLGIGALYGRFEILDELPPFLFGGDMILTVSLEETIFNSVPRKFEAGTPNVCGAIGFAAAVDYLNGIGMPAVIEHEHEILSYAVAQLKEIPGVTVYGPEDLSKRSGVLSFNVEGVHPHDVAAVLDTYGVCVRSGDHCGQPLMKELGIKGGVRASFYIYNTLSEVDLLVEGIKKVKSIFK